MFKGSYSVTITPTSNDGKIKVKSLEKYFDWQIKKKIGGLIILGSTGEFLSISDQNRSKMIRESVSIVDSLQYLTFLILASSAKISGVISIFDVAGLL